ncbi:hypothetical protein CVT26_004770, partial [Gymnopilus dilepis]
RRPRCEGAVRSSSSSPGPGRAPKDQRCAGKGRSSVRVRVKINASNSMEVLEFGGLGTAMQRDGDEMGWWDYHWTGQRVGVQGCLTFSEKNLEKRREKGGSCTAAELEVESVCQMVERKLRCEMGFYLPLNRKFQISKGLELHDLKLGLNSQTPSLRKCDLRPSRCREREEDKDGYTCRECPSRRQTQFVDVRSRLGVEIISNRPR